MKQKKAIAIYDHNNNGWFVRFEVLRHGHLEYRDSIPRTLDAEEDTDVDLCTNVLADTIADTLIYNRQDPSEFCFYVQRQAWETPEEISNTTEEELP